MIVTEKAHHGMTATTEVDGIRFKAPQGICAHATELAGPEREDIQSTNNDTIYCWDLGRPERGALHLRQAGDGRSIHTTQFIDAFSNNFAYVSARPRTGPIRPSRWSIDQLYTATRGLRDTLLKKIP